MHDTDRTEPLLSNGEFGYSDEAYPGGISEEELEYALAAELLSIDNDEELDQFLGKIIKKAGKFVRSKAGRALGNTLRGVAKAALPKLGGALGTLIPVPGVGTMIGTAAGSLAASALEAEADEDDMQFETARRFVRLANTAVQRAANAPPSAPPQLVARKAVEAAAKVHAPALLRRAGQGSGNIGGPQASSGRWVRSGGKLIIMNA